MTDEQENTPGSNGLINKLRKRHVNQAAATNVAVPRGIAEVLITLTEKLGWPD